MENETAQIRLLEESDPPSIAAAFNKMGWNKPEAQYRRYLREQATGTRTCFIAIFDGQSQMLAALLTENALSKRAHAWRSTMTS